MRKFLVRMAGMKNLVVDATMYDLRRDLVFSDDEGEEVGRIIDFGLCASASVFAISREIDGEGDGVEVTDEGEEIDDPPNLVRLAAG